MVEIQRHFLADQKNWITIDLRGAQVNDYPLPIVNPLSAIAPAIYERGIKLAIIFYLSANSEQTFKRVHWSGIPNPEIDGILPKGPYPPCLRMADRALLAGYPRNGVMGYARIICHSSVHYNYAREVLYNSFAVFGTSNRPHAEWYTFGK